MAAEQLARVAAANTRIISYRADIDGLRAVAVLAVIAFHLNRAWLPGGYVGVDIFFVISGFLITRIISREMAEGRFSFRWFYVKRMRRILPVFYTVTVCTVVVGSVLLLPADVKSLMDSARHAIFFVANVYFGRSKGYFDIAADEKPLLHTWSLAIEEQYYLFWPLLLLAMVWACRLVLRRRARQVWPTVAGLTLSLAVGGYVYAQYALVVHPGAQEYYFQIQTRFSELMTGSFIALVPLWNRPKALRALAYLGALLILAGLTLLTEQSRFPGVNAILPCVGAALIIYAGQSDVVVHSAWLHRWLGLKAMSTVGLWSYSLYLWHWPILAY
ncbi:MAG: acyltransferase, partial [Rhodanobacteraceae bacterium]